MKIPIMQTINFKAKVKSTKAPNGLAISLAAKKRIDTCFELVKAGEKNMNVLCHKLDVHRVTLIRYLNKLAAKKLIRIYSVSGHKYKIIGVI